MTVGSGPEFPMQVVQPLTDQVEAEFIEEGRESGAFIISRHDPRAGSEGRLDPGLPVQSAFDRALGKQAGCQHDRGI
jgi:hypothetical protein